MRRNEVPTSGSSHSDSFVRSVPTTEEAGREGLRRRVRHVRHALALFEARQHCADESLEVAGLLVGGPTLFVEVELEDEERARD
jgi:hypothetical protein